MVVTVAVCEEWIYRGFAQWVLQDWSGGIILAGIAGSAVMFALAHLYQGPRGVFATLVVGILFSVIRTWTGSLMAPLVAHFIIDIIAGCFPCASAISKARHQRLGPVCVAFLKYIS